MKETRLPSKSFFAVSRREYFTLMISLALSLGLIFSNRNAQVDRLRAIVIDSWGFVLKGFSWYSSMKGLQGELTQLRRRTTHLLLENSQLREAALENHRLRAMLGFKERSHLKLISAKVVARNRDRFVQTLVLDAGREKGVFKNMPLISPAGLVGKVLSAGKFFSTAQLMINHNFRAACRVQRSRVDGILAYENGENCLLTQVPKNSDVKIGDVVVTSEYSSIFPPGILVGIVIKVNRNNTTLFMDIEVKPAVDFSRIEEVFAIQANTEHATN